MFPIVLSDRILPLSGIRRNRSCRRNVHAALHLGGIQFCLYVTPYKFESRDALLIVLSCLELLVPIIPSLISYVVGLIFYASHFPERILRDEVRKTLDMYGGSAYAFGCLIIF